jgi:hypothetical protein
MSREEAAAKELANDTDPRGEWEKQAQPYHRFYMDRVTPIIAAADAHDLAHGVHRIVLDEGTVERAARALCESIWKLPNAWVLTSDLSKRSYLIHARALLAAVVQEERA